MNPSTVMPMNVPPNSKAERQMPGIVAHSTLMATPTASMAQAAVKAFKTPIRLPSQLQTVTEGIAANPKSVQTQGSSTRTSSVSRTMATRNVAVMT